MKYIYIFLASLCCLSVAQAVHSNESERGPMKADRQESDAQLSSAEFLGIKFEPGHPLAGESFANAVNGLGEEQERRLEIDAGGLMRIPGVRVEIVGFTDNQECSDDSSCCALSLRRAKLVYDWFVERGIPKDKLNEPKGYGSEMAIYSNETEEGRRQNRRVEVNMIAP